MNSAHSTRLETGWGRGRKKKGGGQTLNDGDDVTKSVGAHYLARCVDNVTHVNRIHMFCASLSKKERKSKIWEGLVPTSIFVRRFKVRFTCVGGI